MWFKLASKLLHSPGYPHNLLPQSSECWNYRQSPPYSAEHQPWTETLGDVPDPNCSLCCDLWLWWIRGQVTWLPDADGNLDVSTSQIRSYCETLCGKVTQLTVQWCQSLPETVTSGPWCHSPAVPFIISSTCVPGPGHCISLYLTTALQGVWIPTVLLVRGQGGVLTCPNPK